MKQSSKEENSTTPIPDATYDSSMGAEDSSNAVVGGSSLSSSWSGPGVQHHDGSGKGPPKSVVRHGPPSDCTSVSADSPGSRHSVMTGVRSFVSYLYSLNLIS